MVCWDQWLTGTDRLEARERQETRPEIKATEENLLIENLTS
jgi:hypothetical protein